MLKKIELFTTKKEFLSFFYICLFILFYALLIEYNNYNVLSRFNTAIVDAQVVKQYTKTRVKENGKTKEYQVLKLDSNQGYTFYTTVNKNFADVKRQSLKLKIFISDLTFYEYMTGFYAYSHVVHVDEEISLKKSLNNSISSAHKDERVVRVYQALYSATPLPYELQTTFSNLGVSHLLAISGFHLGVLASVLFFMFKSPYKLLQQRYFPYRSYKVDSFIFISLVLLFYLVFLDSPPSLLRAYAMLVIGFFLYDRGYKIVSMQTLLLTVVLLLSFFPKLFFSIGFWLSVSGVFYIFLFLIHFKHLSKVWQFILVPFWVYFMMLPFSLFIFGNFSIYHPLSIIWTSLFTLFYPLSIFAHIISQGDIFDSLLIMLLNLSDSEHLAELHYMIFIIHIILSFISIYKKNMAYILALWSLLIFVYAIQAVT
jgi:competence protein ComEC